MPKTLSPAYCLLTAVFGCLLIINAASPYIGLKWEYSLNMYSDLDTDGGNHFFLPATDYFGMADDYYIVERIECDEVIQTESLQLFKRLLHFAQHPAAMNRGEKSGAECRPVNGNVVRHQLVQLQQAGESAVFYLRHHRTGERFFVDSATTGPVWTEPTIWNQYPILLHSYKEIHQVMKEYHTTRAEFR